MNNFYNNWTPQKQSDLTTLFKNNWFESFVKLFVGTSIWMYIMVNTHDFYGTIEVVAVDHNVHSDWSVSEQHCKRLKLIIFKKWVRPPCFWGVQLLLWTILKLSNISQELYS